MSIQLFRVLKFVSGQASNLAEELGLDAVPLETAVRLLLVEGGFNRATLYRNAVLELTNDEEDVGLSFEDRLSNVEERFDSIFAGGTFVDRMRTTADIVEQWNRDTMLDFRNRINNLEGSLTNVSRSHTERMDAHGSRMFAIEEQLKKLEGIEADRRKRMNEPVSAMSLHERLERLEDKIGETINGRERFDRYDHALAMIGPPEQDASQHTILLRLKLLEAALKVPYGPDGLTSVNKLAQFVYELQAKLTNLQEALVAAPTQQQIIALEQKEAEHCRGVANLVERSSKTDQRIEATFQQLSERLGKIEGIKTSTEVEDRLGQLERLLMNRVPKRGDFTSSAGFIQRLEELEANARTTRSKCQTLSANQAADSSFRTQVFDNLNEMSERLSNLEGSKGVVVELANRVNQLVQVGYPGNDPENGPATIRFAGLLAELEAKVEAMSTLSFVVRTTRTSPDPVEDPVGALKSIQERLYNFVEAEELDPEEDSISVLHTVARLVQRYDELRKESVGALMGDLQEFYDSTYAAELHFTRSSIDELQQAVQDGIEDLLKAEPKKTSLNAQVAADVRSFCEGCYEDREDFDSIKLEEMLLAMEDSDQDEGGLYDRTNAAVERLGLNKIPRGYKKNPRSVDDLLQALQDADDAPKKKPLSVRIVNHFNNIYNHNEDDEAEEPTLRPKDVVFKAFLKDLSKTKKGSNSGQLYDDLKAEDLSADELGKNATVEDAIKFLKSEGN